MKNHCLLALVALSSVVAVQAEPVHFGCQARTFGEGIYKDEAAFLNVVQQVGEVGFEGIETNYKNLERYFDRPADFAKILKNARLTLIGAHMGGSPWNAASVPKLFGEVERTAQFVKAVGGGCVVFSGSLPKIRPLPPDTWQKMAEFMNEVGRVCAKNGVRCLDHTHWWECGGDGLEQLCKLTDPKLVGFALDTGHAVRAGADPSAMISVLAGRLGLIHFADASDTSANPVKRPPLGEGRMNIPAVVEALRKAGFHRWIVLEEETTAVNARPLAERGLALFRKVFQEPQ